MLYPLYAKLYIPVSNRLLLSEPSTVATLAQVYGVQGNVSDIARQGSGSACRSMYGGFVEWLDGESSCGSDSIAQQVVDENYWPEMRILILVVSICLLIHIIMVYIRNMRWVLD